MRFIHRDWRTNTGEVVYLDYLFPETESELIMELTGFSATQQRPEPGYLNVLAHTQHCRVPANVTLP